MLTHRCVSDYFNGDDVTYAILRRIASSPNYFAIVEKQRYYLDVLAHLESMRQCKLSSEQFEKTLNWELRLSPKESGTIIQGVAFRKYQPWTRQLNMDLLRVQVGF